MNFIETSEISENHLNSLSTSFPLRWWQTLSLAHPTDKFTFRLRDLLMRKQVIFTFLVHLVNFIKKNFTDLPTLNKINSQTTALIESSNSDYSEASEFGDESITGEFRSWDTYRRHIKRGGSGGESRALYQHVISKSQHLLSSEKLGTFFNLGVCYPFIDSELAKLFPDVRFIGFERTAVVPLLNNHYFAHQTNMRSESGDLFEHLARKNYTESVFFHARTLTLLPKTFVKRTYTSAHQAGFEFIFGNEQTGVSRHTKKSYRFSYDDAPTELFRKHMVTHNYPALLQSSGWNLIYAELLPTEHADPDFRIFTFIARRK